MKRRHHDADPARFRAHCDRCAWSLRAIYASVVAELLIQHYRREHDIERTRADVAPLIKPVAEVSA